ncbi:unnamed protein product [Spirodela intermedia]|uniref:Uncharacterized protein n=1 Tax=Spirodela intermedia TaxID=51605 RepID=A0A7I8L5T4_SPIIN|nr:unnamed protein product [Spirodela intermedia]
MLNFQSGPASRSEAQSGKSCNSLVALVLHIDDILIISPNMSLIDEFNFFLHTHLHLKDLGTL